MLSSSDGAGKCQPFRDSRGRWVFEKSRLRVPRLGRTIVSWTVGFWRVFGCHKGKTCSILLGMMISQCRISSSSKGSGIIFFSNFIKHGVAEGSQRQRDLFFSSHAGLPDCFFSCGGNNTLSLPVKCLFHNQQTYHMWVSYCKHSVR